MLATILFISVLTNAVLAVAVYQQRQSVNTDIFHFGNSEDDDNEQFESSLAIRATR